MRAVWIYEFVAIMGEEFADVVPEIFFAICDEFRDATGAAVTDPIDHFANAGEHELHLADGRDDGV